VLLVEAIALGALDDLRSGTELLVADLERDLGMGTKVVVPARIRRVNATGAVRTVPLFAPVVVRRSKRSPNQPMPLPFFARNSSIMLRLKSPYPDISSPRCRGV